MFENVNPFSNWITAIICIITVPLYIYWRLSNRKR